ncbi:MAG: dihydropteroate synthase family protein [Deltaproteobacteria bacterium]|jgi:dihydropteroate synthase|nr:dihydropteroate synthase family protein [Deltaproteobacteria bacterium]
MSSCVWTIKGGRAIDLAPFTVAGIVNVTPDSFSDGGLHFGYEKALAHSLDLLTQGARILDLGGESTRPGAQFVDEAEEKCRIVPLVRELDRLRLQDSARTHIPAADNARSINGSPERAIPQANLLISVDTWRAGTSVASLEAGADIINDISGSLFDPALPEVLATYKPGYILGHCPAPPATMQDAPHYENVVEEVYAFFARQMNLLVKAGLPENRIVLDPCPGFGKNLQHNLALMRNLARLQQIGRPLCIAISRKTLIGNLLGLPARADNSATSPRDPAKQVAEPIAASPRDPATQVLTALLYGQGACLHRVHDVAGAWNALRLAQALQY